MENKKKKAVSIRCLAEGGVCVALAVALSYAKIPIDLAFGGFGGSIDLVMIPLIVFAVRWGAGWGVGAAFLFGTLKYFLGRQSAISWVSIIFDYSAAYALVGLAGLLRRKYSLLPLAALIGCAGRFLVHFISGVTVYAQYMPEEFMGVTRLNVPLYSLLYNGTYMLPNTVLAVLICALLIPVVKRLDKQT